MNDIDICNFADDTTAYVCDVNLESVPEKLEENSELVVTWFEKDYVKLNTELNKGKIWESNKVKLLGVKTDNVTYF